MQKREKIEERMSWMVMVPVISPRWWRFVAWRGSKIQAQSCGLCLYCEIDWCVYVGLSYSCCELL